MKSFLLRERVFLVGAVTAAIFLLFGKGLLSYLAVTWAGIALFLWLFAIILWLAFGVVRHADCLAVKLGEPYGTLILTLAVIGIEATMIASVMLTGANNPTLARDTMFAVVMIVLNGMLGVTLLVGGMRHHEQEHSLPGAQSYLGVLLPLAALSLVIPRFTESSPGGTLSPLLTFYLLFMSVALYCTFLFLQTRSHRKFFEQPGGEDESHDHGGLEVRSVSYHAIMLVLTMTPIVLLSKSMAKVIDYGISALGAPQALGGFLVAILILSPEGMSAIKAALANRLQRTVNISLGSATSTIGMTVPVVMAISIFTGQEIELGLEPLEIALLAITIVTTMLTFGRGKTSLLQGVVHLVLFVSYIVLIID